MITRIYAQDRTEQQNLLLKAQSVNRMTYTVTLETEGYGEGTLLMTAEGLSYATALSVMKEYHVTAAEWSVQTGEVVYVGLVDVEGAYCACEESECPHGEWD